ncbi:uncharacterized protein LOC123556392 [Mercenaria mercenaria]|uniref:uncharacterized protein LOC123556392 n=1 Tax=Mercenaria mercenaria TaxID=6596 RepID=UPI00234F79E1|nr:uncharacterized protein LOC123556392 [Mercenaria mercenaria]
MYRVIRKNCASACSLLFTRSNNYSSRAPPRHVAASQICKELSENGSTSSSSRPSVLYADKQQLIFSRINDITDKIHFRHAVAEDIDNLVAMTNEEGWWYTAFHYKVLLKLDPFAITVAADEADTPVGFIGVCNVLPGIAYNGPFIVRKDFRGVGIGNILNKLMKELIAERNGCMDLDHDFVEHYVQKGFIHKSYKFKLYKLTVSDYCRNVNEKASKCNIVPITNKLLPFVLEYDRGIYRGLDRERILRACLFGDSVHTVAALCDETIKGYGSLIKSTTNTYSISTLFGDSENVVEDILGNMLELVPNGASLIALLVEDKQLSKRFSRFETYFIMQRIFNKFNIETDLDRMYYVNDYML